MRCPHAIATSGDLLFVADAGNHSVIGWRREISCDDPANLFPLAPGDRANRALAAFDVPGLR